MVRSRASRRHLPLVLLFLLTHGSCGPDQPDRGAGSEARDSAGIRIVENHRLSWAFGEDWQIDTTAVVRMGAHDGDEGLLWRVMGVTRLSDGRVAVLNSGSGQVRYFDARGRFVHAAGGLGGGPGEFQFPLALVRVPVDTLVVLDRTGKESFFTPQGTLAREISFQRPSPSPDNPLIFTFDTPLPNGTILGRNRPDETNRRQGAGWFRPTIHVRAKDSRSNTVADFGTYGEIQQEMLDVGGRPMPIVPPFARMTSVGTGGDEPRIVVGDNERFELRVFDLAGTLLQLVRRSTPQAPVIDEEVEAWKDRQRVAPWVEGQLPELERGWSRMRVPETKPAFGTQLGVSTDGFPWVAEYTDAPIKPRRLHIFDPTGVYLGDLEIPEGLAYSPRAVEIGPNYFLAVYMDELGVETVRLYPLIRNARN